MISSIQSCFPRTTGNGWNILKIHILTRMIPNMLKSGAAEVFSGQHGERFLMSAVKDLSSNTRRQSASYVQNFASRVWERGIIDTAYHRGVVPYLNEKIPNNVSQIDAVSSEFTLSTCAINALGQGQYFVKWKKMPTDRRIKLK